MAVFCLFLYTFLHEGGHALGGILSRGTVTGFNVNFLDFSAHVSLAGGFTQAETVANTLAGPGTPLLTWLVFILVVPKRTNFALESVKLAATMMFLSTLLAWVILPLVYVSGEFPRDDVTDFLIHSGAAPLGVTIAALGAYIGGWLLFFRKIDGVRQEVKQLRVPQAAVFTSEVRTTLWICLGILLVCILIVLAANG
ncbi:MAG: hypothetical protein WBM17_05405 [Anaerolineales bacterium]